MKTREQAVRALAQTAEDKMLLQQLFVQTAGIRRNV